MLGWSCFTAEAGRRPFLLLIPSHTWGCFSPGLTHGEGSNLAVESCQCQDISCWPRHSCSSGKQGVPSHSCARSILAMALQREQHQELRLWPLPGTVWEESIPLVDFQTLLLRLLSLAIWHSLCLKEEKNTRIFHEQRLKNNLLV